MAAKPAKRRKYPMPTTSRRSPAKNGKAAKHNNNAEADCGALADALTPARRNGKPGAFTMFAQKTAQMAGRPATFMLATLVIIVWGVTGPLFGYSDTWQLVINTG